VGVRRDRDRWVGVIAAFAKSKRTVSEFCSRSGINEQTFRWWRWKLRPAKTNPTGTLVRMLPVTVTGTAPTVPAAVERAALPAEIVVEVGQLAVRVPAGVDAKFAAELIAELRSRC
jgi:hypothetical protein